MCGCLDLYTAMIIVMAINIACCIINICYGDIFNFIVYAAFTVPFILSTLDKEHVGKRKVTFICYTIQICLNILGIILLLTWWIYLSFGLILYCGCIIALECYFDYWLYMGWRELEERGDGGALARNTDEEALVDGQD